jgi:hypothetical protein
MADIGAGGCIAGAGEAEPGPVVTPHTYRHANDKKAFCYF